MSFPLIDAYKNGPFDLDWETAETIRDKKFGHVQKVYDRNRGEYIISKIIKKKVLRAYSLEYPEYKLPESTPENHIARFLGYGRETDVYVELFWEYYDQNTLHEYAKYYVTTEEEAYSLFLEVVEAVYTLHTNFIVHMDIKEKNIFVKNHHAYLGDFGFSRVWVPGKLTRRFVGTVTHISPEMCDNYLSGKDHMKLVDLYKQDAWTLGIVYYYLLFKKNPHILTDREDSGKICKRKKGRVRIPPTISQFSRNILESLLDISQEKRMTVTFLYENVLSKPNVYQLREKIRQESKDTLVTFKQLEKCISTISKKYNSIPIPSIYEILLL